MFHCAVFYAQFCALLEAEAAILHRTLWLALQTKVQSMQCKVSSCSQVLTVMRLLPVTVSVQL